jgi:transcription elongation GreA/GreB family factor
VIDKRRVLALLRARLDDSLRSFAASQGEVQAGAVHEEARQEDPKDTRGIEASYLARGLAERVELLQEAIGRLARLHLAEFGPEDPIAPGALVGLSEEDGSEAVYFVVPVAGGERLDVDGATVRTLTPASPLGRALVGKERDDEIELQLPGKRLLATIDWVR